VLGQPVQLRLVEALEKEECAQLGGRDAGHFSSW
jgi:hypothetical protein